MSPDEVARVSADLRARADEARARSEQLLAAGMRRRMRIRGLRPEAMLRLEMLWSRVQERRLAGEERRERARTERERAGDDEWMRAEIASMLRDGWTREEMEEVGFGPELLASLGLRPDGT